MNDGTAVTSNVAAETESLSSDSESCPKLSKPIKQSNPAPDFCGLGGELAAQPNPYSARPLSVKKAPSSGKGRIFRRGHNHLGIHAIPFGGNAFIRLLFVCGIAVAEDDPKEIDFFTKQARLQIEARMALAQAKDIAHMQMEVKT